MPKISSITLAAVVAAGISTSAAYAGDSMTCTDSVNGGEYSVRAVGGKIKLKGSNWSTNLTPHPTAVGNIIPTKTGKNGVFTNVNFAEGWLNYYKKGANTYRDERGFEITKAYRKDRCDRHPRQWHNLPNQLMDQVLPTPRKTFSVLDGIKGKCAGEWPGDYAMQKWCIDRQVGAYNALLNY